MRTSDNMKGTLADIASLVKDEFKTISTSYAILLVLVGGIFLYGLLCQCVCGYKEEEQGKVFSYSHKNI